MLEDLVATRLEPIDLNVLTSSSKSMPSTKVSKSNMATFLTTHNRKKWATVDYLISTTIRSRTLMSLSGAKKGLDLMHHLKISKKA